ncbi:MAG: zf-HC2 domain-containing protein [Planctomycetaceae bacterium]
MNCEELQNLIPDYVLGEASTEQSDVLRAHLDTGCVGCVRIMAQTEATLAELSTTITPIEPPDHLEDRLLARVETDSASTRFSWLREHDWVFTAACTIAACFLTAILTWQSFSTTHSQNAGEAQKLQRAVAARKDQIGALRRELASDAGFAEILRSEELYVINFRPADDKLEQTSSARAVFDGKTHRLGVTFRGLPKIEVERTLRLWLTVGEPLALTDFTTTAQGDASVIVTLPDEVSIESARLAVSEDRPDSQTPGRLLLVASPQDVMQLAASDALEPKTAWMLPVASLTP